MFRKGIFGQPKIVGEFASAMATLIVLTKTRLLPSGAFAGLRRLGSGDRPLALQTQRNVAMAQVHRINL